MAWRAQGRKPRRPRRSSLAPWLSLAAAAHAVLLLAAFWAKRGVVLDVRRPSDGVTDPFWLDLLMEPTSDAARGAGVARSDPADLGEASEASEPPRSKAPAPAARRTEAPVPAPLSSGEAASAPGERAPPSASAPVAEGADGAARGALGSGPSLSLRDLGVDRASNPFIGSVTDLPTERQRSNQRLRESLRGELAKRDQARGLGPEGPAVTAVTEIVMASATAPNTSALLRVRTDGAGAVTLVDVLEADRDHDEWQRIASELVRALAGKKLRVPAGTSGVSFQLRVVSRVQLPSGADPGLAVDVLGIPLKKGDGKRSTKLSILSPMVQEIEVPNSNGLRVPVVSFALLGGIGDPADIGAVARRLVTAYLVAMDTDILRDTATAPGPPSKVAPSSPAPTAPASSAPASSATVAAP